MGNLTKGKTTKRTPVKRSAKDSGAAASAAVAATVVSALQAALGKAAVEQSPPAAMSESTFGSDLLLTNVQRAKALTENEAVASALVMTHDRYGRFYLRAVEFQDGYLIGVVDSSGATYCECEIYDTRAEMEADWKEWLTTVTQ